MPTELMETSKKVEAAQNGTEHLSPNKVFAPSTDIYEAKDHLLLLADMPGVKQEDVDITLEHNILTIHGRVEVPKFAGHSLTHAEYGIGNYRRVFALSNEIDRNGIQASVKNGVLKLILPKSKSAMPRKISLQME